MNIIRKPFLLVLMVAVALTFGCRTKTKVTPKTTPDNTSADSVGDVNTTPDMTSTVSDRADFVDDNDRMVEEVIPSDIGELNKVAQERGWIRDAYFDYDEATLSAEAQEALTVSASWLKNNPTYALTVEGHCDSRGTEQYNLALGDRRANVAKDYLATLGVDSGRIRTVSYGEERPFDSGTSDESYHQNRRAHLVLGR